MLLCMLNFLFLDMPHPFCFVYIHVCYGIIKIKHPWNFKFCFFRKFNFIYPYKIQVYNIYQCFQFLSFYCHLFMHNFITSKTQLWTWCSNFQQIKKNLPLSVFVVYCVFPFNIALKQTKENYANTKVVNFIQFFMSIFIYKKVQPPFQFLFIITTKHITM